MKLFTGSNIHKKIVITLSIALWCLALGVIGKFIYVYGLLGSDFTPDYMAAFFFRRGLSIYDPTMPIITLEQIGIGGIPNYHPPFTALIYLPFSYLPYQVASWLWSALIVLLYVCFLLGLKKTLNLSSRWNMLVAPLLFLWYPFLFNVGTTQASLIIVYLIFIAWKAVRHSEKTWVAGACLAFASFFKLFPMIFCIYFVLTKQWRNLLSFSVVFIIGIASVLHTMGIETVVYYISKIIPEQSDIFCALPLNVSITGTFSPLLRDNFFVDPLFNSPEILKIIIGILFLSLLIPSCWVVCRLSNRRKEESFLLFVPLMQLLSPISWAHMFLINLLVIFYLLKMRDELPSLSGKLLSVCLLLFSFPDVLFFKWAYSFSEGSTISPWIFILSRFGVLGLLLLWGVTYNLLLERSRKS
ncbi:glycosyltransferase family 87 protein [Desulfobacula sp.]|uniref:glycosyltransferase family 87 protein n=1 Tax=Desulfobacula sp. TaxID=2593537 RepID=UPI002714EF9F|nr:glycosyltransferase family 87 protein [Desulfobacula sp.]